MPQVSLEEFDDVLRRPLYAHVATLAKDGSPRNSPVAFEWDGKVLRFSTTRRRLKARDILRNPHVAISIIDPDSPLRHVQIRGIASIEDDPTAAFADRVTQRYTGRPYKGDREARVIVTVVPNPMRKA
ncbi:MAG TPA: PPOX class F420-dependent oxidoreductase [Chloroflexota bacterium]